MNKRVIILLAVVWTAALGLVGFSELRPDASPERAESVAGSGADPGSAETGTTGREPSEDPAGGAPGDREGASVKGGREPGATGENRKGVTLRIGGGERTEFSGSCTVDGEEREIGGKAPQTYTYEPERKLRCEVSSRDGGALRVSFSDGEGTNTVQQVGPGPATLDLVYTGDGLSTSMVSGSRTASSQTSQSVSIQSSSQVVSSQSSSSQSSSSVVRSGSE